MADQRLPIVNSDDGAWGDILNEYLGKEHYNGDGNFVPGTSTNGSHKTITVRPGTTAAGTAPIKLTSGPLMTTPEAGAIEFLTDGLYFTQTGSTERRVIPHVSQTGATGDIYYRHSTAQLIRLAIGSTNQVLSVAGGVPSWQARTTHTPTAVWGDGIDTASVSVGTTSYVRVPYSGTITSWHIIANISTTCVLDVWRSSGSIPTVANTITASAKPTLTTATTATSSTLTGWSTAITAGDVLGFNLQTFSAGTPTSITLVLDVA